MSKLKYTMIENTLHSRPEWRNLQSDPNARLAYFVIHTSAHISFAGYFHYPVALIVHESMLSQGEVLVAISKLENANLIEYDPASEWVRIKSWYYHSRYAPENKSRVTKLARTYLSDPFPATPITVGSIAEFVVGTLLRVGQFSSDSKHGPEVVEVLRQFVCAAATMFDGLSTAMTDEMQKNGRSAWRDFEDVTYGLIEAGIIEEKGKRSKRAAQGGGTLHAPCLHPAGTVAAQKKKKEENKKRKEKIADPSKTSMPQGKPRRPLPETLNSPLVRSLKERIQ